MPTLGNTASFTGTPLSGSVPLTVVFTSTVTQVGTSDTHSTEWDFGDGTTATTTGNNVAPYGVVSVSHTYAAAGTYTVTAVTTFSQRSPSTITVVQSSYVTTTAPAGVTVVVTSSASPSLSSFSGGSVELKATLSDWTSTGTGGTVTFFDGTTKLGVAPVNASGVATLVVALAASGNHSISATFSGDSSNSASASAGTFTQVISAAYVAGADTSSSSGMSMVRQAIPTVYKHVQATAATTWTIKHYLKGYPAIDVYVDTNGVKEKILADQVTYVDLDTCTVTFTTAFSGTAMVS